MLFAGQKSENFAAVAKLLDFRMELASITLLARLKTGDDLIADFERLAGEVGRNILAERNDFARTFVTELNRAKAEGIAFKFVNVSAANAATFNLDENFIVADFGNRYFMNNHLARLFENRHFARFRYAHFIFPFDDVNVKLAEANRALMCSQVR
jgi:hypothetical protein